MHETALESQIVVQSEPQTMLDNGEELKARPAPILLYTAELSTCDFRSLACLCLHCAASRCDYVTYFESAWKPTLAYTISKGAEGGRDSCGRRPASEIKHRPRSQIHVTCWIQPPTKCVRNSPLPHKKPHCTASSLRNIPSSGLDPEHHAMPFTCWSCGCASLFLSPPRARWRPRLFLPPPQGFRGRRKTFRFDVRLPSAPPNAASRLRLQGASTRIYRSVCPQRRLWERIHCRQGCQARFGIFTRITSLRQPRRQRL